MYNAEKIIEAILEVIESHGVRWLNDKDLTAKGGTVECNMAIDFSEKRLVIVAEQGMFKMILPTSSASLRLMQTHPILKDLYTHHEGVRVCFILYKKHEKSHYTIGPKIDAPFGRKFDVTIDDVDEISFTNEQSQSRYKDSMDVEHVKCFKAVILFFYELFKNETFYKELDLTQEDIRNALSKVKYI